MYILTYFPAYENTNYMLSIDFQSFPVLTTPRLRLREIQEEDKAGLFKLRSDSRVMEFLDTPLLATLEEAAEFVTKIKKAFTNNEGITWVISLHENPELIGTIGFWRIIKEHHRAEIGYMLIPEWQGKGIMQEALQEVMEYGFKVLNLHSVEANINPANQASLRLMERNQFVREAYFRENFYYNGRFLDSIICSRLAPK